MISIVSVNYKSHDWACLLTESARRFSEEEHEIIILDNTPGGENKPIPWAQVIKNAVPQDTTHGCGLNQAIAHASGHYVLILDIDCHFLVKGWEDRFRRVLNKSNYCISVKGSDVKPLRPACVFMQTQHARKYDWRATPGYQGHRITPDGFDVGIQAYHEMVKNNLPIYWMEKGDQGLSRYETLTGEEYGIGKLPLIYHHWHGAHLEERNKVDYTEHDLLAEKDKLFARIPWRKKTKMV